MGRQLTKALMESMTRKLTPIRLTPAFKTLQMQPRRQQSIKALMESMTRKLTPIRLTPAILETWSQTRLAIRSPILQVALMARQAFQLARALRHARRALRSVHRWGSAFRTMTRNIDAVNAALRATSRTQQPNATRECVRSSLVCRGGTIATMTLLTDARPISHEPRIAARVNRLVPASAPAEFALHRASRRSRTAAIAAPTSLRIPTTAEAAARHARPARQALAAPLAAPTD
jgi:hypothetical protein